MEIYHNHLKAIIKLVFGISEGFKYGTPSPGHDPQPHFGRTDPPHTYNPIPHGPYPTEPPHTYNPTNPHYGPPEQHYGPTAPPHTYNPIPHGPYPTEPPHTIQPHNPGQYSLATESPKHGK